MAIHRFFTKNIIVRRDRSLGGNKIGIQATATVNGWYEDLSPEARAQLGVVEQRAWRFWFDIEEDIKEGDELADENDNRFYVREVTKKEIGINQHLEVLAVEHNV